jgi:hypothetical protein
VIARNLLALGLFVSAAPLASAQQCFDFADGFGTPGNGLSGPVYALEVFDDGAGPQLYAGGQFPGTNTRLVRRWDGTSWSNVALAHPSSPGTVRALGQFDGGTGNELWAGGQFVQVGGTWANNVAKWDGFTWTSPGTGTDGTVLAFEVFDDGGGPALYVGGEFTHAGGLTTNRIARWDGTSWSAVGSLPGHVHDLAVFDDGTGPKLYAAGNYNGRVRVWTGSFWSNVGGGLFGQSATWTMAVHDDGSGPSLYVGGWFIQAGGSVPVEHLARWDGTNWHAIAPQPNGSIQKLFVHDEGYGPRLFAVGTNAPGSIARWDGSSWSALSSGVGLGAIEALESYDDGGGSKLFLGGEFMEAGDKPSHRIARFGETCTPVTITVQPQSLIAAHTNNHSFEFSVEATGTAPLSYQWRRNGVPLVEGERIQGSQTPDLSLSWWDLDDAGDYDCVVTNPAGSVASNVATFTVPLPESGQPWAPTPLLLTPEPVENPPGGDVYTSIGDPDVASSGEIAFYAEINGTPSGPRSINLRSNGIDSVIHRQGEQAPGCESGATFSSTFPGNYETLQDGRILFDAKLANWSLPYGDEAIYFHDNGTTSLVARSGMTPPGSPAGEIWRQFSTGHGSDAGQVAFSAVHFQGSNYVASSVWTWTAGGGLQNVLRTGQPAPGTNANFLDFNGSPGTVAGSRSGILAVSGRLDTLQGASWIGPPGALQLVTRGGDPAPGYGAGDVLGALRTVLLAEDGDAAVSSWIDVSGGGTAMALYAFQSGSLQPLLRRGDPAPADLPGAEFFSFEPRAMNLAGDIVFYSNLSTTCVCPSKGLFLWRNGVAHTIVTNRADPLPGAPPGFTLFEIRDAALNEAGQVVFDTTLFGGSSVPCAFGWSLETGLFPICPPGSQVLASAGDVRTSYDSWIADTRGNGIGNRQSTALDEAGTVVFSVTFPGSRGFYSAPFHYLHGAHNGPGVPYCFGDGSGAPCPCSTIGTEGRGCANSTGDGARLHAVGSVGIAADDIAFHATNLPPSIGALLFQGTTSLNGGIGLPFHNGLKCAGGAVRRFGLLFSDFAGNATWGPGLAGHGQWLPGDVRNFQVWYRDIASPCGKTSNTTNGLRVTFTP